LTLSPRVAKLDRRLADPAAAPAVVVCRPSGLVEGFPAPPIGRYTTLHEDEGSAGPPKAR
jgi:hypothetical protein